ncbi:MAG: 6-bladed beta-propeller [Balneolaceae bacterium]|nr:6-bladed beta-propeller [Balneolaceae bacterium]
MIFAVVAGCSSGVEHDNRKVNETIVYPEVEVAIDSEGTIDGIRRPLGVIHELRIDENKNMYISDKSRLTIHKFDSTGTFIRGIGSRGRGAGEFMDVNDFQIIQAADGEYQLMVVDGINRIISTFTPEGEVGNSYYPISPVFPRGNFLPVLGNNETRYLFLYKLYDEAEDSDCLFHLYNSEYQKISCFGSYENLKYSSSVDFNYLSQGKPGHFVFDDEQNLYLTPFLYAGTLYRYKYLPEDGTWIFDTEIEGYQALQIDPLREKEEPFNYQLSYRGQTLFGRIINRSLGLFRKENRTYHFVSYTNNGDTNIGLEIFDTNDKLVSFATIPSLVENDSDSITLNRVLALDKTGHFYFVGEDSTMQKVYRASLTLD